MDEKEKLEELRQRARKFKLKIVRNKRVNADLYYLCNEMNNNVIYSGATEIGTSLENIEEFLDDYENDEEEDDYENDEEE